jgi:hypothetical protein
VVSAKPVAVAPLSADRTAVRLGIANKGRMSDLTRQDNLDRHMLSSVPGI